MEEEWSYVHLDKHLVLDCKKTNPAHHETISTGLFVYPLVLIYPAYKEIVELGGKICQRQHPPLPPNSDLQEAWVVLSCEAEGFSACCSFLSPSADSR